MSDMRSYVTPASRIDTDDKTAKIISAVVIAVALGAAGVYGYASTRNAPPQIAVTQPAPIVSPRAIVPAPAALKQPQQAVQAPAATPPVINTQAQAPAPTPVKTVHVQRETVQHAQRVIVPPPQPALDQSAVTPQVAPDTTAPQPSTMQAAPDTTTTVTPQATTQPDQTQTPSPQTDQQGTPQQ
jgi:hypothetical protein